MFVETGETAMGFFDDDDSFSDDLDAMKAADPFFAQRDHRKATNRRGGLHAIAEKSALAVFGMPLRDLDREAAKTLPPRNELEAAYDALRTVAGYDPDHAALDNNIGFARSDVALGGHALASAPASAAIGSPGMALMVWRLAMRYRRQVPPRLNYITGFTDQSDLFN